MTISTEIPMKRHASDATTIDGNPEYLEEGKLGYDEVPSSATKAIAIETAKFRALFAEKNPTLANPGPIGLGGFALTTFVLSMFNAGAITDKRSPQGVVMGLAMFYGGLVQLLAGMWEVSIGNTFGATAFAAYGGFWMSFAALFVNAFGFLDGYAGHEEDLNYCLGIYLFAWCLFSGMMTIAAHRKTLVLFALLFTVWLTFLLLSINFFMQGNMHAQQGGGIVGIVAAGLAWYLMMAGLLDKNTSLFILPVWPMDPIWKSLGFLRDEKE